MTEREDKQWLELAPWHTDWPFAPEGGRGKWTDDGTRVNQFFALGWPIKRVLELSCLEGAHTFHLGINADEVVALEGRQQNVDKVLLLRKILVHPQVYVHWADIEHVCLSDYGRFDSIFCSGILYHLQDPLRLLKQCASVSDHLFIWTHYSATEDVPGGRWVAEDVSSPTSGLSPQSFWPTLPRLLIWLGEAGWEWQVITSNPQHPNGPAVTLACTKG